MTAVRMFMVPLAALGLTLLPTVALATTPTLTADAGGSTTTSFSGEAEANIIESTLAIPNFLIVQQFFDGPGPTAEAAIDSLGNSTGFASAPYPGETANSVPGLVSTLSGKSVPTYPFIVSSSYPSTPADNVDHPGYHIDTSSTATSSTAEAILGEHLSGTSEAGGFSQATVSNVASGFTAVATSHTDFNSGGVVLSGVVAAAEVDRAPDGTTTKTSSLSVASFSIGGVSIGVGKQGLTVLGAALPLNLGKAVQSLSLDGATVTYLKPSSTGSSEVSPGIEIQKSMNLPNPVNNPVQMVFILGQASADAGGVSAGTTVTPPVSGVGPATGVTTGAVTPPTTGIGASSPVVNTSSLSGGGSVSTAAGGSPVVAPSSQPQSNVAYVRVAGKLPRLSFYPIIAVAALVIFMASVSTRRLTKAGPTWSS